MINHKPADDDTMKKAKPPQGQKARKTPLVIIIAIAVLTPLASTLMFYFWQPAAATHKGEVMTAQTENAKDGAGKNAPALFPPSSWQNANDEGKDGENAESGENAKGGGGLADNAGGDWREQWRGKWILLHTTTSAHCDEQCRRRLCRMRQLRLMLPGHYLRINRAWLINKDENAKSGGDIGAKPLTATSDCGEIQTEAAAAQRAAQVDIVQGVFILRGEAKTLPPPSGGLRRDEYLYLIDPAGRLAMRFAPTLNIYNIRSDLSRLLKLSRGWRQTE
ncbi:MAG: hypothetical protein ACR2P4_02095 [Gammaproteobacteria bacterium]